MTKKHHKSYAQAASAGESSGENPPPYSAQSQPQTQRQAPSPMPPQQQRLLRPYEAAGLVVVMTPHDLAIARARRRFFGALFWAFMIYLVVGVLFGDYHLENRRHKHRHQISAESISAEAQVVEVPAPELTMDGDWLLPEFV